MKSKLEEAVGRAWPCWGPSGLLVSGAGKGPGRDPAPGERPKNINPLRALTQAPIPV